MAAAPVKPSEFKEIIPQAGSSLCRKMLLTLVKLPVLIYRLAAWAIKDDGTVTDDFKAWLGAAIGTEIGPPTGVSASDGTFDDKVHIVWNPVVGASSYEVWMGPNDDPVNATLLGSASNAYFDHSGTGFEVDKKKWYFVKARTAAGATGFSAGDEGFADSTDQGGAGSTGSDEGGGSTDWVVPAGVTKLTVELWGAGGGGGGCYPSPYTPYGAEIDGGGGGGSGEYIKVVDIPVTPNQVIHFEVGSGGAGGEEGGTGGDTRIVRGDSEVLVTAKGGSGGGKGQAYGNVGAGGAGGTGGSATVGTLNTQTAGNAGSAGTGGYRAGAGAAPGGGAGGAATGGGSNAGGAGSGAWYQKGSAGGMGKWKKSWS